MCEADPDLECRNRGARTARMSDKTMLCLGVQREYCIDSTACDHRINRRAADLPDSPPRRAIAPLFVAAETRGSRHFRYRAAASAAPFRPADLMYSRARSGHGATLTTRGRTGGRRPV